MESSNEFTLEALKNLEPLVNPVRQYRNRSKKKQRIDGDECQEECNRTTAATASGNSAAGGETKLSDVLSKITSVSKASDDNVDRTKLIRTYNVKLRLKKPCLYKCFDCDCCFTNADFLELHEKSHNATSPAVDPSGSSARNDIDLQQEQSFDESEMIVKQNAWFADDFGDADEQDGDDDGTIQLDCTVEEREDNFDITFDRTKCEKTYTVVKYKVKKEPVGKCDICERMFYTGESLQLHRMEHERFMDFDAIEPAINIDSPNIEESTLVLDESFYQAESEMDSSDILDAAGDSVADARLGPTSGGLRNGECKPIIRRPLPQPPIRTSVVPAEGTTTDRRFQCEICSKRFRFRPAFDVHVRTHDNSRPYQCAECHRRFVSRAKLFLHSYGHSRDRRADLRCQVCGDTFARPHQLLEHLKQGHATTETETG